MNSVVAIIILMPAEQDIISHWFNRAHLHVLTSDRTPGGFSPSISKVINASLVYEYYIIKSGYEKNRLTKQTHSTALLNMDIVNYYTEHLFTKIHFYIVYLITTRNLTWQHVQGMDKNNGNSCERYTFLYWYGVASPFAWNTACMVKRKRPTRCN